MTENRDNWPSGHRKPRTSGHRMPAENILFPRPCYEGMISTSLEVIWEISAADRSLPGLAGASYLLSILLLPICLVALEREPVVWPIVLWLVGASITGSWLVLIGSCSIEAYRSDSALRRSRARVLLFGLLEPSAQALFWCPPRLLEHACHRVDAESAGGGPTTVAAHAVRNDEEPFAAEFELTPEVLILRARQSDVGERRGGDLEICGHP